MTRNCVVRIVEQCQPGLERLADRLCRDRDERDDLLQNTRLRALEKGETMGEGELTGAWLTTVMWNLSIDSTRRADRRFPHQNVDNVQLPAPLPEPDPVWARLTLGHVERALPQLPDEFRTTFELFELKHLSQQQIAAELGLPVATVSSRVRRARQQLKQLLGELVGADK